ncbi:MAG: hypothetical protein IPH07_04905 [Deltaproteobacteria bacterium]|nr:hypothetical protein [Deltaproteobacteria bacterium]MBK8237662.1 hypothetical protein [Deltaproteobacteria bacterium]MBP7290668.1 hypothetical protein [Nannocystaceae bacterium]
MAASHEYRLTAVDDRLEVWQRGAPDLAGAARFVAAIETALADCGARKLVFDNRETTATEAAVREHIIAWVRAISERCVVAVVLRSEMLAVRLNMEALAHRARTRAFGDQAEALAWLAKHSPG